MLGEHVAQQSQRRGASVTRDRGAGRGKQLGQQANRLAVGLLGRARRREQDPPEPGERHGVTPVVRLNQRSVQHG